MMVLQQLGEVAKVVPGFAFGEIHQGKRGLPIPFFKVSDFANGKNSWLSEAVHTVDDEILSELRAKIYPAGTIVFPKVGGALLTNKRARLAVSGTFDNNIMGLIPTDVDGDFLFYFMCHFDLAQIANIQTLPSVRASDVSRIAIPVPSAVEQRKIAADLKAQLNEVDRARRAAEVQLRETSTLADAIVAESISLDRATPRLLAEVLDEVKEGIGEVWNEYPVLGATKDGLALAKEPPGKKPERYKPAFPGTVFYNPMRILIGSIAFVDEDNTPGITSPDYVVLHGKEGKVDIRWFYHWLRSPLGEQCIQSLARGAVRERMLFNRLKEGAIELPDFSVQKSASTALARLKPVRRALERRLAEINLLPPKLLTLAFQN